MMEELGILSCILASAVIMLYSSCRMAMDAGALYSVTLFGSVMSGAGAVLLGFTSIVLLGLLIRNLGGW